MTGLYFIRSLINISAGYRITEQLKYSILAYFRTDKNIHKGKTEIILSCPFIIKNVIPNEVMDPGSFFVAFTPPNDSIINIFY